MKNDEVKQSSKKGIQQLKSVWPELDWFDRFDYLVTVFVSGILAIVILVAVIRLTSNVFQLFQQQLTNHIDFTAFQTTFGMLLTLLIAFEFRNSLNAILERKSLLIQVRIVVLIAILALARKFLVLDPKEYDAAIMAAYAAMALSLGVIYWLISRSLFDQADQPSED